MERRRPSGVEASSARRDADDVDVVGRWQGAEGPIGVGSIGAIGWGGSISAVDRGGPIEVDRSRLVETSGVETTRGVTGTRDTGVGERPGTHRGMVYRYSGVGGSLTGKPVSGGRTVSEDWFLDRENPPTPLFRVETPQTATTPERRVKFTRRTPYN